MVNQTGLDMAYAATPQQVKAMLVAVGGTWVLVYVGGPRNGGHGWGLPYVQQLVAEGITSFLPCYVGRQIVPSLSLDDLAQLTADQGYKDGQDAVACMQAYEWGPGCPAALDVEYDTAQRAEEGAVAYCDGWCKALRDAGYKPGVYAPLFFLQRLWQETNRPQFGFAADWTRSAVDPTLSPENIAGLDQSVFSGARVWQYAGGVWVNGINVDIDTADIPLAPPPGTPMTPREEPPKDFPTAARYKVTTTMYLRTSPVLNASHGVLVHPGDELTAVTGNVHDHGWTLSWRYIKTIGNQTGWAYAGNLSALAS